MPIDPDIVGTELEPIEYEYTNKDVILYALGIGAGAVPDELKYVYEGELEVLPTFAVIPPFYALMGFAGMKGADFNLAMLLHGEQYLELYQKIPVEGKLISYPQISGVFDKLKGALIDLDVVTRNTKGEDLFLNRFSAFIRGEGGFGGERGTETGNNPPGREPDRVITEKTLTQQALIYRLSGDFNPLHADPQFAAMGGFENPILHGLCSFGFAARAVLHQFCHNDPAKFKAIKVRFSNHVYPGETLVTEMWQEETSKIIFRSKTAERNAYCLTNAAVWLNESSGG